MTTLEKIRSEIAEIAPLDYPCDKRTPEHIRDMALDIIDKYAEQDKLMIIEANVNGYTQGLKDAQRQSCENCKQDPKECRNDAHYGFCENWEKAEQEPKTGHWIRQDNTKEPLYGWYFCSECNSVIGDKTEFCSNCGAKMESEDKE